MTYFHTGICTIIGAKAFHCPVRNGKEWFHLAMVVRHKGLAERAFCSIKSKDLYAFGIRDTWCIWK